MILPLGRDEFLVEQRPSNQSTRCILGRADEQVDGALLEVSGDPSLVRKNKSEADVGCFRLQERDEFRCEDGSWIVRCGDPEDAAARGGVEDLRDIGELAQSLDQLASSGWSAAACGVGTMPRPDDAGIRSWSPNNCRSRSKRAESAGCVIPSLAAAWVTFCSFSSASRVRSSPPSMSSIRSRT
jgi:hypothetical protein